MPSWTFDELMSNATHRIGQRSDIPLADCKLWTNQAYADVVKEAPHALLERTTLFSVSSGDSQLQLPADFLEPITLSLHTTTGGSAYTLEPTQAQWADAQGYFPVGTPQRYFIYGDKIQLWPSANSSADSTVASGRSFQLRYRARASDMSALTDVPSVDTDWRLPILYLTEAYLHEYVGNAQEGATARAKAFAEILNLDNAHTRRQRAKGRMAVSLPQRKSRRSS